MVTRTPAQRLVDAGEVRLPDDCPPCVDAHAWGLLVRHVRDRVPYAALGAELRVSSRYAGDLADQAAAALRHPELADLPSEVRRVLVQGGYTTREAVARASDADLLLLKGLNTARLREVRAVIPRAE